MVTFNFKWMNDAVGVPCDWARNEWILKKTRDLKRMNVCCRTREKLDNG
jgi:hypothetical protein